MKDRHFNYVQDLTKYERQETWEVNIGGVGVGGTNPIRIQTIPIPVRKIPKQLSTR
jgi:(E)-4-hydroxy-3-methylbut-2-enyl-diphosphate synthase